MRPLLSAEYSQADILVTQVLRCPTAAYVESRREEPDIADYLGLTIETVSRTMTQLERGGTIEMPTARQIKLRNTDALEELCA